jgi:hypothetical protein
MDLLPVSILLISHLAAILTFNFQPFTSLMSILQRLITTYEELQHGESWLDYNAENVINRISAQQALAKGYDKGNTIWELVNHLAYWRTRVGNRLVYGKDVPPAGENFYLPEDRSEESWQQSRDAFQKAYEYIYQAILNFDESKLDEVPEGYNRSYYTIIIGLIEHDAFHLGQIVLLARAQGIVLVDDGA